MAYTSIDFDTKTALVNAVKAGQDITVFQPGMGSVPVNGKAYVEGPQYPRPHKWYAEVVITNGRITKVK